MLASRDTHQIQKHMETESEKMENTFLLSGN